MTDYIKRVAEAVREECAQEVANHEGFDYGIGDIDVAPIIARVTMDAPSELTDEGILKIAEEFFLNTDKDCWECPDEWDIKAFARAIEQRVRGGQEPMNDGAALYIAREALWYYADGEHFVRHEPEAWDTVSGEPINFYEDEANTATVEDGSIAKQALETIAGAKHLAPPPAVPDVMYVWPAMEARQVLTEYGMTENEAIDVEYRLRSLIRAQLSAAPRQEDQP